MKWSSLNNVTYERWGHSASRIGDFIYLFGGYAAGYGFKNELHKYAVKNKTLQKAITSGNGPCVR